MNTNTGAVDRHGTPCAAATSIRALTRITGAESDNQGLDDQRDAAGPHRCMAGQNEGSGMVPWCHVDGSERPNSLTPFILATPFAQIQMTWKNAVQFAPRRPTLLSLCPPPAVSGCQRIDISATADMETCGCAIHALAFQIVIVVHSLIPHDQGLRNGFAISMHSIQMFRD